ncbi:MAG: response regulator transcription factor, partial [Eubacterium sp.]|nr:response regulator transcription factor [Eubacterium sp.]
MSKILIIEDEEAIANLEKDYLELSDFEVEIAADGNAGLNRALNGTFDLIVLDLMLPGVDGFAICQQIREQRDIPVIIVSARKDDIDKIRGLGMGADDYITKPFDLDELLVRVEAVLRRYEGNSHMREETIVLIYKNLSLDITAGTAAVCGSTLTLTGKEFAILALMLENPAKLWSKANLF